MPTYKWRDGAWRDNDGNLMDIPERGVCAPMIASDIPDYMSPLGTGLISGRRARREELRRNNLREVDPGEFKPAYYNKKFAAKRGLPVTEGVAPSIKKDIKLNPVY
jgi:hypothetical protein